MTINLQLKPELEAGLLAKAQAGGKTLEEFLLSMVEGAVVPALLSVSGKPLSPDQRAAAYEAWSSGHRSTPPLSDYAVSREGIYEGPDAG